MGDSDTATAIAVRRSDHYAGRSREQREADRRDRIAAAAVHLFASRDYDEVTVADVCAHAKVSKRYFYDHFADREDLLLAVHREQNDWLLGSLVELSPPRPATVRELLDPVMRALVRLLAENPERARVIYVNAPKMELRRRGLLRAEAAMFGRLLRPMLRTKGDETHGDDKRFDRTMLALVAGISEVIIEWVGDGMTAPADELADDLSRLAVAMLERSEAPGGR
ncbi:putative transcriptional regulator, TetR family protein [Actinoplanes italicus]|uniref:TetR family transcriptional regulator n=1 Tax=Actinoplanes italicus TaxID=113567 RepID=A0A2T0K101_9ACTN|nr:TetR/AcrR family transcriptional regulator [Actinoplanes italicus]PRX16468.1 TetR family transcriptional regulator [Actinoplanes italicus]GIE33674.1 putative transcriptional regulator, TetR family protein [Actinoplanes italicus]